MTSSTNISALIQQASQKFTYNILEQNSRRQSTRNVDDSARPHLNIMLSQGKTKTLKFIGLTLYLSFLATVLLTATSYGEKSTITDLSTVQLFACSITSACVPLALAKKKGDRRVIKWLIWMTFAIGFAFLAIDDKYMIHEQIDNSIHSTLQWEETKLSDRIDDIIVGIYGIIGLIFIRLNRHHFQFSPRFIIYARIALVLAFAMVLCDMKSIYGLSEYHNQILEHLEEWTKIFGGGVIFIGLLCALEDALDGEPWQARHEPRYSQISTTKLVDTSKKLELKS